MRATSSTSIIPRTRLLARLVLPMLVVAVGGWFAGVPAQDPPKKLPKPEEYDPNPPKLKPVRDPEKSAAKDTTPPAGEAGGQRQPAGELAVAARQTNHMVLRQLFLSLAVPHDVVTMRQSGAPVKIEPIPQYVGPRPRFKDTIKVRRLGSDGTPSSQVRNLAAHEILGIEPYEQIAITQVENFLKEPYDRLPEQDLRYLSRRQMLEAAAQTLTAVVRFHESARVLGQRQGKEWESVEKALRKKLLEVEVGYLEELARANDWDAAVAAARQMVARYPQTEDRELLAVPLTRIIDQTLKAGGEDTPRLVQQRLKTLNELFPGLNPAKRIGEGLRRQAERLFAEAKELANRGRTKEAQEKLHQAEDLWPQLPGLYDARIKMEKYHSVLRVGVRDLPVELSPATACTDSERWAVELLFEGLVKLTYDPETGQRYEPGLAEGRPRLIPMGRQFQIARDAYWSDGRQVTGADVRSTVNLLRDKSWIGYRPSWAEMIEGVHLGGDPFQVSLLLRQGFLDPLSLMTFKILPPDLTWKNHAPFARNPVGSGPYQYHGQMTQDGRTYAVFVANPSYGRRVSRRGLPLIREIHFVKSNDPVHDFKQRRLDLLLDLPAKKVQEVAQVEGVVVPPPMPNRRVYFLAINHRRPALQNQDLRRALGLAVPRQKLLDEFFRPRPGVEVHRPLTGPYPADSWAAEPSIPSLDRPDQAKGLIGQAAKKGLPSKLTLKFPNDDPQVVQAMEFLCAHLSSELGITIEPEALEPHRLRDDVELNHSYDLAYYHYDYPSDAYWLWPLFDPSPDARRSGGSNYLGYRDDGELVRWFRAAMMHRDFPKVQEYTRLIHDLVQSKMLLIPLWQLDTCIALRKGLKPTNIDPLLIFTDVEHWTLRR
ncbi:MAG TPA: ABC transporter substrate-binding protein [Gemmataceae bacterium]|nr:ABC transporter substrate-binding protein [Gemmataceae bacterium]